MLLLGKKIGQTSFINDNGTRLCATVLNYEECRVIGNRTFEKDGYSANILGFGKSKKINNPQIKYFEKNKIKPCKIISENRTNSDDELLSIGDEIKPLFEPGQKVTVQSKSTGKGFAGAMKRHNFGGLRASHGVSISHRAHGSTGNCQDPGRVFKGKKMAGHLGHEKTTVKNLEVLKIDLENKLIFLKGAVPGKKESIIKVFYNA